MTDPNRPRGATTESLGLHEQPRLAEREVSPLNRVDVKTNEHIDLEGLDPDSLDPDRHYRLVPDKNHRLMRKRQRQGYIIERLEGGVRTTIEPETNDGTIRFGDRILMSCPKALFMEREEERFRFSEGRLAAVTPAQKVKDGAKAAGTTALDYSKTSATEEQER